MKWVYVIIFDQLSHVQYLYPQINIKCKESDLTLCSGVVHSDNRPFKRQP